MPAAFGFSNVACSATFEFAADNLGSRYVKKAILDVLVFGRPNIVAAQPRKQFEQHHLPAYFAAIRCLSLLPPRREVGNTHAIGPAALPPMQRDSAFGPVWQIRPSLLCEPSDVSQQLDCRVCDRLTVLGEPLVFLNQRHAVGEYQLQRLIMPGRERVEGLPVELLCPWTPVLLRTPFLAIPVVGLLQREIVRRSGRMAGIIALVWCSLQ
jgi:hypothetical protein